MHRDTRTIFHHHLFRPDRIHASRGAHGIGQLSTNLGDFRHREKRRQGQNGQQGQNTSFQLAVCRQRASHGDNGQTAEAGHHFQQRVLQRQLPKEGQAQGDMASPQAMQGLAALPLVLEGKNFREPLHRIHRMGIQFSSRFARFGAQRVHPVPHGQRTHASNGQKGQQGQRKPRAVRCNTSTTTVGATIATQAGAMVWAKKYSTS